jgi:hypothetical protein
MPGAVVLTLDAELLLRSEVPIRRMVVLSLLFVAALEMAHTVDPPQGFDIEYFRWEGELPSDARLVIHNPHGTVNIRPGEGSLAGLTGAIQYVEGDPQRLQILVSETDGVFRFDVAPISDEAPAPGAIRRADLGLNLPPVHTLEVHTDDGAVEAQRVASDLDIETVTGDIDVSTTGTVRVRTERGTVKVWLMDAGWLAPPSIESLTGDIEVWLPDNADAAVEITTRGLITTDYSIVVDPRPDSQLKRARAVVGEGTVLVAIDSNRGNVKLLRARRDVP